MTALHEIVQDAIEELKDYLKDDPGDEPHERIHEIADSSVPVYYGDLLELAAANNFLALTEPEIGPAFDGKPTPVNIIAANIYEHIEQELWEFYHDYEPEEDEEEDEEEA